MGKYLFVGLLVFVLGIMLAFAGHYLWRLRTLTTEDIPKQLLDDNGAEVDIGKEREIFFD